MINKTREYITWSYGGMAVRSVSDYRIWFCFDGDYEWRAVVDDFGQLQEIEGTRINIRGY